MRVRFKTISAGPKGAIFPGDLLDVSEGEAKMLVKGGYAEYVTPPEKQPAKQPEAEAETPAGTRRPRRRPADEI